MIYHITPRKDWIQQASSGVFEAKSLKSEGFIHTSRRDRILEVANRIFKGQRDLIILCVREDLLEAEVREEDVPGHGTFPHIYGPINRDSVDDAVDFPPARGSFVLPPELP